MVTLNIIKENEMSYYPAGAECDPRAPWNEQEVEEVKIDAIDVEMWLKDEKITEVYEIIASIANKEYTVENLLKDMKGE